MKQTPMRLSRSVGNRKLNFALINRSKTLRKKMIIKPNVAISSLIQNFLLDDERPLPDVTGALETVFSDNSFEALGRAAFTAMLSAHAARLEASKATLTAQNHKRDIH